MTREDARIKLIEIRAQLEVILTMYGLEISDVFDVAIKALSTEICADCISRNEVLKQINCWIGSGEYRYAMSERFLIDRIKTLPHINPQEPKYCDRKICLKNEHNGISCDECEVRK